MTISVIGARKIVRKSRTPVRRVRPANALEEQLAYLCGLRKVTDAQLQGFIDGKSLPKEFVRRTRSVAKRYFSSPANEFRILDHVQVRRQSGRN
jgi:hypothetical protein